MAQSSIYHKDSPGPSTTTNFSAEHDMLTMEKSTFDSLGIIMENGKPKFRLGEPTFSANPMTTSFGNNLHQNVEESSSFVVLGKSSMEFNAVSVADYEKIQEKSQKINCSSMLSTLTHGEIEQKVTELMQENVKLKETLAQNNIKMKQQFNTLVTWQEELKQVHENHKQKFLENRELIGLLKDENAELKIKIAMADQPAMINPEIPNKSKHESSDYYPTLEESTTNIKSQLNSMSLLDDNTSLLAGEINLPKIEKQESTTTERNLHYLREIIESLKKQLSTLSENSLTPQSIPDDVVPDDKSNTENYQRYKINIEQCNKKIQDLAKSYSAQTSRYVDIQNCLKRSIDSLELFEDDFGEKIKILQDCRSELISEQLQNIQDRKCFINVYNEFQKILSDYKVVLQELTVLQDEISKPVDSKIISIVREKSSALEKQEVKLDEAKRQLEFEEKLLLAEKQLFEINKESLEGEKASLDSQSRLYEAEIKMLQDNNRALERQQESLLAETNKLKEQIHEKDQEIFDQTEKIQLLNAQVDVYKCDFDEEKKARVTMQQEREYLNEELAKANLYKQELLRKLNGSSGQQVQTDSDGIPVDLFCDTCGLFKMPGQWHGPGFCQPID